MNAGQRRSIARVVVVFVLTFAMTSSGCVDRGITPRAVGATLPAAAAGEQLYLRHCAACHQVDGEGIVGVAPPLMDTDWVSGNQTRLINVLLHGLRGPILVNGEYWDGEMPGFEHLPDTDLAQLLSYVRRRFSDSGKPIDSAEVARVRAANQAYDNRVPILGRKTRQKKYKTFAKGHRDLAGLKLPPGFEIAIYAENVNDARSLVMGDRGTVFVGNNKFGEEVYALQDTDRDMKADKKYTIASGLARPNGLAFVDGDLYVAEIIRVLKFTDIENRLDNPPPPEVIFDAFPNQVKHAKKFMALGPDNKLYIPVGADCNVCEPGNPLDATITRMNLDGTGLEVIAKGVRNSVGIDWHPQTGELWFSDNGRDLMGDDTPPCEINRLAQPGLHFGFPHCHGRAVIDPEFANARGCADYRAPEWELQAHTAPLGIKFYTGTMFPPDYKNALFVAEHGSWNRSEKVGYRIMVAKLDGNRIVSYQPFAEGWLDREKDAYWGRPVDILQLQDGSLLISDDWADVIYRISYRGDDGA
ncbi:c-type cytochrome [Exilibacterium tricleocarpae]|uniref:C-type cytochrome n=1 Tax=Exilibacterium tricleocarpae TaxID=2591008 RepID=A0A545U836_9GAMM|nr:PQQ-dependent sugar dehydrogenase [Exilibacterium tricleocarpae]TQV85626.1 c-type cytochrome [Exilibacterium tricleocarpae]